MVYVLQCNKDDMQKAIGVFSRLKDAKVSAKQYATHLDETLFCRITKCPENKNSKGVLIEKR